MIMSDFVIYIRTEAFILIPALYFLGLILDQTPVIAKWTHAWIKLLFSITACLLYFGFDVTSVVQGILVTGAEMVFKDIIHNIIDKSVQNRERKKEE